jgi:hypothetical protein
MELLETVETFLRWSGLRPTALGRLALHDPNFVGDLQRGRHPNAETERKVRAWMAAFEAPKRNYR